MGIPLTKERRMELVNNNFFQGVLGGLGVLSIPQAKVIQTDIEGALQMIEEHGGPAPFCCCSTQPGFYQRGISRVTNSMFQHSGLFVSKRFGQLIRMKHPDL